ncbi:MAG: hypothetical protein ACQER9_01320 [Nanobdellota archaeon]
MVISSEIKESDISIQVQTGTPISKVIGEMQEKKAEEALIFNNKDFKGIFDHFSALKSKINPSKDKVDNYIIHTARISASSDISKILEQMRDWRVRALPLFEKGKLKKNYRYIWCA